MHILRHLVLYAGKLCLPWSSKGNLYMSVTWPLCIAIITLGWYKIKTFQQRQCNQFYSQVTDGNSPEYTFVKQ